MTVNKVILVGNLGKDPELKHGSSDAILNISVATSETRKDKNTGERKQETEWHNVVFYGKSAEIVAQYLRKGDSIYIEGRLKTSKYIDKQGIERYSTQIIVTDFKMLGNRKKDDSTAQQYAAASGGFIDDAPF